MIRVYGSPHLKFPKLTVHRDQVATQDCSDTCLLARPPASTFKRREATTGSRRVQLTVHRISGFSSPGAAVQTEEIQREMEKICVAVRVRPCVSEESINGSFWKIEENRISLHRAHGTPVSGPSYPFGSLSNLSLEQKVMILI